MKSINAQYLQRAARWSSLRDTNKVVQLHNNLLGLDFSTNQKTKMEKLRESLKKVRQVMTDKIID